MKYRYAVCLFSVAFIIQTTFMNVLGVFGATPNLLLCLVVIFSFLYDDGNYGIILGVIFGLLYDVCFSEYIGIAAIIFLVISVSIMLVNIVMNKEAVFSAIVISAAATVIYTLMYWVIMAMLGSAYTFVYMIQYLPLYILYNAVIVMLMYNAMIKKVIKHHNDRYYR